MSRYFNIPGEPQGKGRPRFTREGRAYTPSRTAAYESVVRACYLAKVKEPPYPKGVPVAITILATFAPANGTKKATLREMLLGLIRPTKKPDWDNIGKAIADALNGIAYHDDSQITTAHVYKFYGTEPSVDVFLEEDKDDPKRFDLAVHAPEREHHG